MLISFQKLSEHQEEQKMLVFHNNKKICILYIDDFETLLSENQYLKYVSSTLKQISVEDFKLFNLAIKVYGEF